MNRYQKLLDQQKVTVQGLCSKGGKHEWGIDGAHSNTYCKKCFEDKPEPVQLNEEYVTEDNKVISLFKPEGNKKDREKIINFLEKYEYFKFDEEIWKDSYNFAVLKSKDGIDVFIERKNSSPENWVINPGFEIELNLEIRSSFVLVQNGEIQEEGFITWMKKIQFIKQIVQDNYTVWE